MSMRIHRVQDRNGTQSSAHHYPAPPMRDLLRPLIFLGFPTSVPVWLWLFALTASASGTEPEQSCPDRAAWASLRLTDSTLELRADTPVMGLQCAILGTGAKGISFFADTVVRHFSIGIHAPGDTICNLVIYTLSGPPVPAGTHRLGWFTGLAPGMRLENIVLSDEHGSRIPTTIDAALAQPASVMDVTIFPNPCESHVDISLHGDLLPNTELTISSLVGRTILVQPAAVGTSDSQVHRWFCIDSDGQRVPSGLYLCTVRNRRGIVAFRRMIVR